MIYIRIHFKHNMDTITLYIDTDDKIQAIEWVTEVMTRAGKGRDGKPIYDWESIEIIDAPMNNK